ncbi:hypothetical protein BJX64DRAFT_137288 [Aspergillus heterothallicus]
MVGASARAQKPVGSAAWISTEKENSVQLVDQEMEEIEFPVRYEMEWLNEHMAEVFSNNQFNFTDAFKTPGKLRGKTPRTVRKRDATENRVPLSEIFSSVQKNRADARYTPSPAVHRSPTKATIIPPAPAPSTQATSSAAKPPQPQYPDLTQNLNSFSQYNADSGYHGMPDEDENEDDEMVLTQVATETQLSTQPMDLEPISLNEVVARPSVDRRTTDASFHSAREEVRNRGETVEPMNVDSPKESCENGTPRPDPVTQVEPSPELVVEDKPASEQPAPTVPESVKEPETKDQPGKGPKLSPAKPASSQPSSPEHNEIEKDEMVLDSFNDIGSPSDTSSPARPKYRESSLSFAPLPAREPLTSKSIGGSRLSRTSHIEPIRASIVTASNHLGRQTGHRMTQNLDEQTEKMDVDDVKEAAAEESDVDVKATKLHNKSSTQRLHEKISMLGKMQPSRPTKSIPAAPALSSTQVSYPELPAAKPAPREESNEKLPATTPAQTTTTAEDDWIKPLSSPFQAQPRSPLSNFKYKYSAPATSDPPEEPASPIKTKANEPATKPQQTQGADLTRQKSATPAFSSPQRLGHHKSASVSIDNKMTTTPIGTPARQDGQLSASKSRLQSIVRTAKGLFTSSGGVSTAARKEASSPDEPKTRLQRAYTDISRGSPRPLSVFSPPRQEGRRTRSSTEREEKRKQQELEERKREEEAAESARQQQKLRTMQKAARERSRTESAVQAPAVLSAMSSSPSRAPQAKPVKEPEHAADVAPKPTTQSSVPQPSRQNDRRPTKPTREIQQKPKPQPVSIRVGSALSRHVPLSSSAESSIPAPVPPPSVTKAPPTLKKKASSSSLHHAASTSSFKSSTSSQTQTQRKAQLASERKREQEEREARRKEEQRRELERKRAAQQQEEARRQEARSRAETERRERLAEDPKKAAQMQAIEKRRLENARRLERQGSQQPEMAAPQAQRETGAGRPPSRLGSVLSRTINPPVPNPAKPPKRGLDEEANHRPATAKPGAMQSSGETKRRKTDDEQNQNRTSMRPTMAAPIRPSNILKDHAKKPSMYGAGQHSAVPQPGSSIFKTGQAQRPVHPMDMAKYANGKIPFAEPSSVAGPSQPHRTPGASASKAAKPSPNYPNGENIQLPEIATDSEDEDSDADLAPVPNWAQSKELELLLRKQEGLEADSIFGPIAPFSLEETFKSDKRIKKFRERTSSANWAGPDGLTQEEIRKDIAERQRLRMNGGWSFDM